MTRDAPQPPAPAGTPAGATREDRLAAGRAEEPLLTCCRAWLAEQAHVGRAHAAPRAGTPPAGTR